MMFKLLFGSQNRNFQRLWGAQLISQFGDRIHQLALVALIAQRSPGSTMDLAKLMAFTILPVFVIQPFAGVLVDRWDRRTVLFVCDLIRGLLVLTIPFIFIRWHSLVPTYLVVFCVFSFSRFYVPAKMSIIPDLVPATSLLSANSLVTTTGLMAFVLGAALGGFIIEQSGARNGFIIDAATFFVSGVFLLSMDLRWHLRLNKTKWERTKDFVATVPKTILGEIVEGFRYLKVHREIRLIISMLFILLAAAGSIYVVLIVFIQESFGSVTKDLGILAVFLGAGLFSGVIVYGRWGRHFVWFKTIFFCLMSGGLALMVFALTLRAYPVLSTAMLLSFLLGLVVGPIFVAANTVVQIVCTEEMRGKVFSALEMVTHFAFLTAMLLSAWLSEFIERAWILTFVGFLVFCLGTGGMLRGAKGELAKPA